MNSPALSLGWPLCGVCLETATSLLAFSPLSLIKGCHELWALRVSMRKRKNKTKQNKAKQKQKP